jgi:hypothetical protein
VTAPDAGPRPCRGCQAPTEPPFRTCPRCLLNRALRRRLDDGTGTVNAQLKPLYDLLLHTQNPASARGWLNKPNVAPLLAELATGQRDLTHEALQTYPYRVAEHVRGLLVACGALPEADKVLLDYERWLERRLAANATHHPQIRLLTQFARWDQLAGMRAAAARKPLAATAFHNARRRFGAAARFLGWLASNDITPAAMTQPDLDTWWLHANVSQRQAIVAFWNWATVNGHLPKLHLARLRFNPGIAMTQAERLDLIRACMSNEDTPIDLRVAVILMLLYAQPLTRILRLTVDDITHDNEQLVIRFGEPASPVPEPFATLLLTLVGDRFEPATATRGTSRWLFPGGVPGQPRNRETFYRRVRSLGFPIRAARVSTLRQLVLDAPAPVVATALGFHQTTTTRQATNAGGTWSRYPTGRHGQ